jgi:hypothetical protein
VHAQIFSAINCWWFIWTSNLLVISSYICVNEELKMRCPYRSCNLDVDLVSPLQEHCLDQAVIVNICINFAFMCYSTTTLSCTTMFSGFVTQRMSGN